MKDEIFTIYKATNVVNRKVYIGYTSNYHSRWLDHRKNFSNKNSSKYKCAFYTSIRKYGWDSFTWEILYQSKDKEHCLNDMEGYFISEYRSYVWFEDSNGYNMTLGGGGTYGKNHSEEWKTNHSKTMKGRKFTDDHKKNISISLSGKEKTSEHCRNLSLSQQGDKNWQTHRTGELHPRSKKYIGISPDGKVILIHGKNKFCRDNNINSSGMWKCIIGIQPSVKGWIFYEYDEKLYDELKQNEVNMNGN